MLEKLGRWFRGERSVRRDWLARLPEQQRELFDSAVAELEVSYGMLSVALDEALDLRMQGLLSPACEQAAVSAELFDRLAARLLAAIRALERQGQHSVTLPNVAALDPEDFRGERTKRAAGWNYLFHGVLLASRLRYFHKLRTLGGAVEDLASEYREAAEEISGGVCLHPPESWDLLDQNHFDLNTCLRETTVVLKSFLRILPVTQCEAFRRMLETPAALEPRHTREHISALRDRRVARFRGK